jgi:hypothetical protein
MFGLYLNAFHYTILYDVALGPNNMSNKPWINKAVPLQAWSGPEGSRKLRFPDFMTTAQDCQPYAPAAFTPRKYTWYSFLLERLSRPQGHSATGGIVIKKFQWHHRESNPRPAGL